MKRVYLLVFDGLADWEIGLLTYELNTRNGIPVTTVGFTREPVKTGGGLRVLPDVALAEIDPDNTALLILPGGGMWERTFDEALARRVRDLHARGVPVASICGATVFLARAGLLKGIRHTSNSLEYLQSTAPGYHEQGTYRDAPAVSDQGVITASGAAPVEFAYHVLKALQVYDEAVLGEFAEFWGCRSTGPDSE